MIKYTVTLLLSSLMLCSFAAARELDKPVSLDGSIKQDLTKADHFVVTVQFDIKDRWHTYGEVGEGSEVRTSLKLKLPEGVKAAGEWKRPRGREGAELDSQIHVGTVGFSKRVVIEPSAFGKNIDVVVSYQACTDEYCNRPQSKTVSIEIPEAVSSTSNSSLFDSPVRLSVNGKPLNTVAKMRFLSPAIFDIDGDDKAELVVGTLAGKIGVYENQNKSGTGNPVWGPREVLKDAEGKSIRMSNW